MSLEYNDEEHEEGSGHTFWVSNSDLFLVLSTVFLMLYVVSNLKTGATSVQQFHKSQELARRNEELESQIRVYDTLKDEQLAKEQQGEQEVYGELMDKLSLLQEDARKEKDALRAQARENEKKEFALNKYQALVKSIVNTNMLAKAQIHRRDKTIVAKDVTLEQKEEVISKNEATISKNEATISKISSDLKQNIANLRNEQARSQMSQAELNRRIEKMKSDSQRKIANLEEKNQETFAELNQTRESLAKQEADLSKAKTRIARTQEELQALGTQLEGEKAAYQNELQGLRGKHDRELATERAAFANQLAREQLSAAERARKLGEFSARMQGKAAELEGQIGSLQGKIKGAEQQLADTERQRAEAEAGRGRALASSEALKASNERISGELGQAREQLAAKQKLAQQIKENFKKAGIQADVDGKTGDVTLAFGDDYFDSGSAKLSPTMQKRLEKFIPQYAAGLFKDKKTAEKISSVEITGFASSTYKGKYVPPNSLSPEDQDAVNYNLKLSFSRANSIFQHIFDTKKLQYANQKTLLPLVKVVGRGFLPEGVEERDIPKGMPEKEFCSQYNCKRAQRVIIKFNLKD